MKPLEYIKAFKEEKETAYQQVLDNPQMYDEATKQYAKVMKQEAEKWYQEALKREEDESV